MVVGGLHKIVAGAVIVSCAGIMSDKAEYIPIGFAIITAVVGWYVILTGYEALVWDRRREAQDAAASLIREWV